MPQFFGVHALIELDVGYWIILYRIVPGFYSTSLKWNVFQSFGITGDSVREMIVGERLTLDQI